MLNLRCYVWVSMMLRLISARLRPVATLSAVLPLLGAAAIVTPSQAATVSCQAIDATSLLSGNLPAAPACTSPVEVGDTFQIDFSNLFTSNAGNFALSNTYSLQIANINNSTPANQFSFSDVELLITGTLGATVFSTPTAISIWQATGQSGQGISGFSTNGAGQDFGFGTAFKSANFTLTAPQTLGTFGTAGVINTIPFNLGGVTSFTSALIRGRLSAASDVSAVPDFSAGLAIFSSNNPTSQPPNIVYGNSYNAVQSVPGPLPVLALGAAFGFSRRLRRRLKAEVRAR